MFVRGLVNTGKGAVRRLWTKNASGNIVKMPSSMKTTPTASTYDNTVISSATKELKPIVWIDCEMTGLDHLNDHIIEICCIVTDGDLNILDTEGDNCYESVVHCDKKIMDNMGEWCIQHHGESGLTKKVIESKKTKEQVESELLHYIKKFIPERNVGVLAGNSIHMDRLFMLREFPKVIEHLFYRLIDVSSIMEVSKRHNPELASVIPKKITAHTAKKDILESIDQLKWYTEHYFKNANETKDYVEAMTKERGMSAPTNTADLTASLKRKSDEIENSQNKENSHGENKKTKSE